LGGQQQAFDEMRALVREAEEEKQRLQAEVERLRTSSSAQAKV
jgi:predicted phage gp36 major capsid-like protein